MKSIDYDKASDIRQSDRSDKTQKDDTSEVSSASTFSGPSFDKGKIPGGMKSMDYDKASDIRIFKPTKKNVDLDAPHSSDINIFAHTKPVDLEKVSSIADESTAASSNFERDTFPWSGFAGHTVHLCGEEVVWPDGKRSIWNYDTLSINISGQEHSASTDGTTMWWDDETWTNIGAEVMDGHWMTNSGHPVEVAGNCVTWVSGERSWLVVTNSKELFVKVLGRTYKGTRKGSKIVWSDGDTWTPMEQPPTIKASDLHSGTVLRVLKGAALEKEWMSLIGHTVLALAKSDEKTAQVMVPDGKGTLLIPVKSLAAMPSPPPLLQVHSQNRIAGDYELAIEMSPSGMPIWKHVNDCFWQYTSFEGKWCFGTTDSREAALTDDAFAVSLHQHWGSMPHEACMWVKKSRHDGKSVDAKLTITSVTKHCYLDERRPEEENTLKVMALYSPPRLYAPWVWQEWAKAITLDGCADVEGGGDSLYFQM